MPETSSSDKAKYIRLTQGSSILCQKCKVDLVMKVCQVCTARTCPKCWCPCAVVALDHDLLE